MQPATVMEPGTFALPGMPGATYTIGRDHIGDAITEMLHGHMMGNWPVVSFDIETMGLGELSRQIKSVTFGVANSRTARAVICDPRDPYQAHEIRRMFANAQVLTGQNTPFDVPPLYLGELLRLADMERIEDTLIYGRAAVPDDHTSKSLRHAANRWLGTNLTDPLGAILKTLKWTKARWFAEGDLNIPQYRHMAAADAVLTAKLWPVVKSAAVARMTGGHPFRNGSLDVAGAEFELYKHQVINRLFLQRNSVGLLIDPEFLDRYDAATLAAINEIAGELEAHGVAPGNSQSMVRWLAKQGQLPAAYPKTPSGLWSGTKGDLELLAHPLARDFVRHKNLAKVKSDYLDKTMREADAKGRIHPQVNILGASSTGRMSVSGIPYHQFPKEARGIIVPDPGDRFVSVDWEQQEPVFAANASGAHHMLGPYERGEEKIYHTIGRMAHIKYDHAKVTLLAQLYGQGLSELARKLLLLTPEGEPDVSASKRLRGAMWALMPEMEAWVQKMKDCAQRYQLMMTVNGRILTIPFGSFGIAAHCGVNYRVQGSGADMLMDTVYAAWKAGLAGGIYLAMHDELVISESIAHDIAEIMCVPSERYIALAHRDPILRTDMSEPWDRWKKE
jgi:DNA polymerase I